MGKFKLGKKSIFAILLTAACVTVGILCVVKAVGNIKQNETVRESDKIQIDDIFIIADGGNGTSVPKNTTYAIDDLSEKFFTSVKIDARLTRDNIWVALEDSDISCVTNASGDVSEYAYYDLMRYNLKKEKANISPVIETVKVVARHAEESGLQPIIFIHNKDKQAIDNLLSTLSEDMINITYFASSNMKILEYIEERNQDASLILYVDEVTDETLTFAKRNSRYTICFDCNELNKKEIEKLVVEDVQLLCRGADSLKDIEKLYNLGVKKFITDSVKVG